MKKNLIIINGTMGVGKTTVCEKLQTKLQNSFWLDGDWCWMMNPWKFTDENKDMVIQNITYILNNFLNNSSSQYVILSWVLHEQSIFDALFKNLKNLDFDMVTITLYCTPEELRKRLSKDNRDKEVIERSIERISLYGELDFEKIDTTFLSVDQTVDKILNLVNPL
ncbi:AAA family ATPase [Patescibacteria group bacterium]|nr:AAA family ATPase [Patescibacteria group bacterium]